MAQPRLNQTTSPPPLSTQWDFRELLLDRHPSRACYKTPAFMYIDEGEQPVPSDEAPKTHDLLRTENFPVHCIELRDHDHNYRAPGMARTPGTAAVRQVNFDAGSIVGS